MFEESRENTGGVIAGMLRSLEDGHLDIVPSAWWRKKIGTGSFSRKHQ